MRIVLDTTEINSDISMFLMELVPRFKPVSIETSTHLFHRPFSGDIYDDLAEDAVDELVLFFADLCEEEKLNLDDMLDDWGIKENLK